MKVFRKILSIFLRIGVSIGFLVVLSRQLDFQSILGIIRNAHLGFLLAAFSIYFFSYLFCLLRWQMLLQAAKIEIPLKRVGISFAGGIFFSLFLPSTIGGDVMRSIDLGVHTKRPHEVVATVLVDRLSGYAGLVTVTLFALIAGWRLVHDLNVLYAMAIIIGILLLTLMVLFNKFLYSKLNSFLSAPGAGRIRESIKTLHQEVHIFRHRRRVLFHNVFLSLIIQAIAPLAFYFLALSLGLKLNLLYFFVFIPIIGAITLLPISIGGLGLRDATTVFFFAKAGVSKDLAFAMSLLSFFFIVVYSATGGLIYALTVHHRRLQYHQPPRIQPTNP